MKPWYDTIYEILLNIHEEPANANKFLKDINNSWVFKQEIYGYQILDLIAVLKSESIELTKGVLQEMALSDCLLWNVMVSLFLKPGVMKKYFKSSDNDLTRKMLNNIYS